MTPTFWPDVTVTLYFGGAAKSATTSGAVSSDDVTAYVWWEVAPISIRMGRTTELDRFECGQLSLTLRDPDRRFDPSNTASPYYPYVRPMMRIIVRARYPKGSGIYRVLFNGYVDTITPQPGKGITRQVQIRASDVFSLLSRESFSLTESASNSVKNVASDILTTIGLSSAVYSINSRALTTVAAKTYTTANVLSSLQDLALTEGGALYAAKGTLVLRDRYYRQRNDTVDAIFGNEPSITASWVLGTSLLGTSTVPRAAGWVSGTYSEQPFIAVTGQIDDRLIRNDIRVTRSGGSEQTASDTTSQTAYGTRTYSEAPLLDSDTDALARAEYLLTKYKDPAYRLNTLTVDGAMNPATLWPLLINTVSIDSRITVVDRVGPGQTGAYVGDCRVEGVAWDISPMRWTTTYRLSPNETSFWIVEDAEFGILESTTRAGW
jgi:hypothetical protein